jgi:hypothetical protein
MSASASKIASSTFIYWPAAFETVSESDRLDSEDLGSWHQTSSF